MIRYESNKQNKAFFKAFVLEASRLLKKCEGINDYWSRCAEFESRFMRLFGIGNCVAMNSGTDALHAALMVMDVKDKEIIIPSVAYISDYYAVKWAGGIPVIVDVAPDIYLMTPESVRKKISDRTAAVIAVHMFGRSVDVSGIRSVVGKDVKIIEDCCQALGTKQDGVFVGLEGDFASWSFSYYKPVSSMLGNGGILGVKRSEIAEKCRKLIKIWDMNVDDLGKKFSQMSMMDIAAVTVKLKLLDKIIDDRVKNARLYSNLLNDAGAVRSFAIPQGCEPVMENYPVIADNRDELYAKLRAKGIMSGKPYIPLHRIDGLNSLDFPNSEKYAEQALHLPLNGFMDETEVNEVCKVCIN